MVILPIETGSNEFSLFLFLPKALSPHGTEQGNGYVVRLLVFIGGVFTLSESLFYVSFFHFLFLHNNNIAASVLHPAVVKHRNRTNAISMLGLFFTWILEIWYLVLVAIWPKQGSVREVGSLFKMSDFCLIPLVQIITSAPMKKFIHQKWMN